MSNSTEYWNDIRMIIGQINGIFKRTTSWKSYFFAWLGVGKLSLCRSCKYSDADAEVHKAIKEFKNAKACGGDI